jgi:hypothetical protein
MDAVTAAAFTIFILPAAWLFSRSLLRSTSQVARNRSGMLIPMLFLAAILAALLLMIYNGLLSEQITRGPQSGPGYYNRDSEPTGYWLVMTLLYLGATATGTIFAAVAKISFRGSRA